MAEKVMTSPEPTAKESAVMGPVRRSARLAASARVTRCEMQE